MREIKFRGISSIDGHWIYGSLVCYADVLNIIDEAGDEWGIEPNSQSQFTGLKDKNSKEIYEDDIILYPYSDNSCVKAVIEYRISEWQSPCYVGKTNDDEIQFDSRCEIIGNIYENKELLK